MKVFISQPMNGKTDAQIREERRIVEIRLHRKLNENFEILDTVFDFDEGTHPLVYLGKSIEKREIFKMIKFIKQLFCRHDYEIEEYFFGDMKNYGRGVGVCKKCGKRKVVK